MQINPKFTDLPAYQTLKILAQNPIDLADPGVLTEERIRKFVAQSAGFRCLFATEQVTDEVIAALQSLANEAAVFSQMQKMQNGQVMNFIEGFPSENRAVLHTALRDFFDHPNEKKTAQEATAMAKAEVDKLKQFEAQMEPFENLVVVGIGGSELGPEAIYTALKNTRKKKKHVLFLSNLDPDNVQVILRGIDLKKTLVMVNSKSGTTLETATNEALVRDWFEKEGLDPKAHFVAVTGEGSPLDDKSRYLECFYIWDWVGGRFCSTSTSGGLVLTFACGFNTYWEFLRGAHDMDRAALNEDITENLPLLGAMLSIWNSNFLNYSTLAIVPYSQALSRWAAHVQQVEMESNGKRIDRQGKPVSFQTSPIFWGEPGTNAQHSFFQMIHQGTAVVPIEFIGFLYSQLKIDKLQNGVSSQEKLISNLFAQALALAVGQKSDNPNKVFPGNRPSHILLAKELTPHAVGALFAYYEHKVVFQGFAWNINSFDQEGVQLGKVLASRFIDLFRARRGAKVKTEGTPQEIAFLQALDTF
jgi:glucose-6-phosphate isomerase